MHPIFILVLLIDLEEDIAIILHLNKVAELLHSHTYCLLQSLLAKSCLRGLLVEGNTFALTTVDNLEDISTCLSLNNVA